jgi:hypothetical protein
MELDGGDAPIIGEEVVVQESAAKVGSPLDKQHQRDMEVRLAVPEDMRLFVWEMQRRQRAVMPSPNHGDSPASQAGP